jgi:hypothetical protein
MHFHIFLLSTMWILSMNGSSQQPWLTLCFSMRTIMCFSMCWQHTVHSVLFKTAVCFSILCFSMRVTAYHSMRVISSTQCAWFHAVRYEWLYSPLRIIPYCSVRVIPYYCMRVIPYYCIDSILLYARGSILLYGFHNIVCAWFHTIVCAWFHSFLIAAAACWCTSLCGHFVCCFFTINKHVLSVGWTSQLKRGKCRIPDN